MPAQNVRIVKGSDALVPLPPFTGSDEEELSDSALVTAGPDVTVAREDGTTLSAPTVTLIDNGTNGAYQVRLTAATHATRVDSLKLTAVATVDGLQRTVVLTVDVVGGRYFTLPELRREPNMADTTKFPTWLLTQVRDELEGVIEKAADVSFVRTYQRDRLNGDSTRFVMLTKQSERPYTLISVTSNGVSQNVSEFDVNEIGEVFWRNGFFFLPTIANGRPNVIVEYEHGWDTPPVRLRRAAIDAARSIVLQRGSPKSRSTISEAIDGATTRYWTPDAAKGRSTGIMDLDAVIEQYTFDVPGIA